MHSSAPPQQPAPNPADSRSEGEDRPPIRLTLNGAAMQTKSLTLAELVGEVGVSGTRYAVMLDDEIVRKPALADTLLRDGAKVELIHMVGGG